MTIEERYAVRQLMETARLPRNEINVQRIRRELTKKFTVDVTKESSYVFQLLESAYIEKNADDLEYVFIIIGNFGLLLDAKPEL